MNDSLLFSYIERRRDFLRYLVIAAICIILGFVIKTDLQEGALPLAAFYKSDEICTEQDQIQSVSVRIAEGDTIYSLFAATPSPLPMAFTERLSKFYELNPHLQLQTLVPGELIQLPIYAKTTEICSK